MNESIIISESVKVYFSSHASLAGIGRKVRKLKMFEPIEQKVKIAQETVKYSPTRKHAGCILCASGRCAGVGGDQQTAESRSGVRDGRLGERAVRSSR